MCITRKSAKPGRGGFMMMELLISLAILAVLLTAVGAAIHAFIMNTRENDRIVSVTQIARSTLSRLTSDVRTADAVSVTSNKISIIPVQIAGETRPTLLEYELLNGTLYYRQTLAGVTDSYELLKNDGDVVLKNFTVNSVMGKDSAGIDCTKSVTAKLVLSTQNKVFSLTASAAPRRNQLF